MSLVGSLEDLGLGDILQIVSLSRKSGLLVLRSGHRRGRIRLVSGQVRAASIEGEAAGLREILVDGGFLSEDEFKLAADAAVAGGLRLEEALAERAGLPIEHLGSLLREQVEQAVLEMLAWRLGEFSFEVREERDERERLLPSGVDAQYFALQATRFCDEARAGVGAAQAGGDEPVFSGEDSSAREVPVVAAAPSETPVPVADLTAPAPLVAVDPDLVVLEWLKVVLDGLFARIHIFQDAEAGVARVRQYLARGERPAVLLGVGDDEARAAQRVRRLQGLCAAMPVVLLRDGAGDAVGASGVAVRPPARRLARVGAWPGLEADAEALREALAPWATRPAPPAPPAAEVRPAARQPDALERLAVVSRQLRESASRGDLMSLVLGFAAEIFPRVALFVVREGHAIGVAGHGLPRAGGPDDAGLRRLRLPVAEPACFRRALESRALQRSRLEDAGDRRLAESLGDVVPAEVCVAPIESGGEVVALLYADALPDAGPPADARALEIVLQEAGLALDHALLARSLAEPSGRARPGPGRAA